MSTITPLPSPPSVTDPANFEAEADAFIAALPVFVTETNVVAAEVEANALIAADGSAAALVAVAAANFKGTYASRTGAAAVPYSVSHLGRFWMLLSNLADVTLKVPGTDVEWQEIGASSASTAINTYNYFGGI